MVRGGVSQAWAHHRTRAGSSHLGEARARPVGHPRLVRQLLLYGFGPEADFEGRLVGALERLESGGALRILDVLFVRRDAESGDIDAIDLHGDGAGGVVAPLLNFRLDEGERRRATERTLRANADVVRELGAALEPGGALAAVLVDHVWSTSARGRRCADGRDTAGERLRRRRWAGRARQPSCWPPRGDPPASRLGRPRPAARPAGVPPAAGPGASGASPTARRARRRLP